MTDDLVLQRHKIAEPILGQHRKEMSHFHKKSVDLFIKVPINYTVQLLPEGRGTPSDSCRMY